MIGFERHVLICTNARAEGHPRGCCDSKHSFKVLQAFKEGLEERGLKGTMRANKSGCLDHCEQGAALVVYPEGVWYGGVSTADVQEIIDEHLVAGRPVDRLVMREPDTQEET